jgi:hypothetical protein
MIVAPANVAHPPRGAMQSIAIDDLKLAEALLAGERRLLEMVATGEPLADVLYARGSPRTPHDEHSSCPREPRRDPLADVGHDRLPVSVVEQIVEASLVELQRFVR